MTNSNIDPTDQIYLLQPNPGSTVGATVLNRVGRSGSLYGDPGWNEVTSESLWPWPYEDKIKEVFSMPSQPPAGYSPTTNNTTRGFAAATDQFGFPMTLTRYIWQYLGTQIPVEIYASASETPKPPTVFASN